MSDFVFTVAKGRINQLALLEGANDALVVVPLEVGGLEPDSLLRNHDDLAALLAGPCNEQVTMGRLTLTAVAPVVDDVAGTRATDAADVVWLGATGNSVGKLLICYNPDTTTATDAQIVPLCAYDFVATPNGESITAQINPAGFFRAT